MSFLAVTYKNMREGLLTGAEYERGVTYRSRNNTVRAVSTKPTIEWVVALRN